MTATNITAASIPRITVIDPRAPEKAKLRVAAYACCPPVRHIWNKKHFGNVGDRLLHLTNRIVSQLDLIFHIQMHSLILANASSISIPWPAFA